ncbi:MAG TPA: hypothetical protein VGG92_14610 [Caulobacteraceae bacterium]
MSEPGSNVFPLESGAAPEDPLPYTVEVGEHDSARPDRVIGRAANIMLARAIFEAAQKDFAGKSIRLRRGADIIAQSS